MFKAVRNSLFALALLAMVITTGVQSANAAIFSDVSVDDYIWDAVNYLKNEGIVVGYEDGTYRPLNKITRAEFLKIVMEASEKELGGVGCYPDVTTQWYAPYVCSATKLGYVKGYPNGFFGPEKNINFAEASKIIVNVMGLTATEDSEIWYKNFVTVLDEKFIIAPTILNFNQEINRGEMAEMIYRLRTATYNKLSNTYKNLDVNAPATVVAQEIRQFSGCDSMKNYVESEDYADVQIRKAEMADYNAVPTTGAGDMVAEEAAPADGDSSSNDFSTTNVQVAGVDEADIVKTDGKNIYLIKGRTVRMVKAYPASSLTELASYEFSDLDFVPSEMFVDDGRIVVMGTTYGGIFKSADSTDFVPWHQTPSVKVYVLDVGTSSMTLARELNFEGDYLSSRKIDNMVYLVANKAYYYDRPVLYSTDENDLVPLYRDSTSKNEIMPVSKCININYVPGESSKNYLVIAGFPMDQNTGNVTREVILGGGSTIYASRESLYVAKENYNYWYYKSASDESDTSVYKFGLGKTDISYKGVGNVPGHILNQFSMDEYDGNFRIATTIGDVWDSTNPSTNNLYILGSDMKQVGKLEGLAPGEKIYSVRFMGEKAYMVTFKKIDPLFVLGLSDPANPVVLGKLKIPGYSDYLHPLDDNHIIGVGKEAIDASEEEITQRDLDFAWYQGMKLALFDVTDVNNPKEMYKIVIGDRGTESELMYNHKALMWDSAKGIMAFPVTLAEIPDSVKNDPATSDNTYGDYVYQGAYLYKVSVVNGFEYLGRITHYDTNEVAEKSGSYWFGDKDIDRILYIGDYLYTVSQAMVKANYYSTLKDIKSLLLAPGAETSGYDDYIYY